jgi:hypothetical protein
VKIVAIWLYQVRSHFRLSGVDVKALVVGGLNPIVVSLLVGPNLAKMAFQSLG